MHFLISCHKSSVPVDTGIIKRLSIYTQTPCEPKAPPADWSQFTHFITGVILLDLCDVSESRYMAIPLTFCFNLLFMTDSQSEQSSRALEWEEG